MKSISFIFRAVASILLVAGALAQAQITGTITDKTTGKPAAGDLVVLVDVRAGMKEVAQATTDAHGRYSLLKPGSSSYLVRVTHQGATYFTAAPAGREPGNMTVYDVAAQVSGVVISEDVLALVETSQGQLRVIERYSVHNASTPPRTQWSQHSFSIVLPPEAVVASAEAQRPSGLPTTLKLDPDGPRGHYSFDFPIQPDKDDKGTLFQIEYALPYTDGKFTFHPQVSIPAKTVWVMVPKSMNFASDTGFQSAPQDPGFQTFVAQNAFPGKALEFTVSGNGALPRGDDSAQGGQQSDSSQDAASSGTQAGSGTSNDKPNNPLSKYTGWILGTLGLVLAASAAFLLRNPTAWGKAFEASAEAPQALPAKGSVLLNTLKDELFKLESEKVAGTISPAEYAQQKAALETVLKRALKEK
jgi:5-hydroxyisourate hydrolase-like protein (transthyretin family)